MDENTQKLIKERFDALPEGVQKVILSSDYQSSLIKIGQEHNLNVEQMGTLELETTMVMMALTPLNNFESELTRELNIDKEKGLQIVKEINEKVFLKIRELLKLMNTSAGEESIIDESIEERQTKINRIASMMPEKNSDIKTTVDERANVQTFQNAGIEIIPEKLELSNNKEKINSVLAQKLTGSFRVPPVKTEHSLENITKSPSISTIQAGAMSSSALGSIKPPSMESSKLSPSYSLRNDPYRLPPE